MKNKSKIFMLSLFCFLNSYSVFATSNDNLRIECEEFSPLTVKLEFMSKDNFGSIGLSLNRKPTYYHLIKNYNCVILNIDKSEKPELNVFFNHNSNFENSENTFISNSVTKLFNRERSFDGAVNILRRGEWENDEQQSEPEIFPLKEAREINIEKFRSIHKEGSKLSDIKAIIRGSNVRWHAKDKLSDENTAIYKSYWAYDPIKNYKRDLEPKTTVIDSHLYSVEITGKQNNPKKDKFGVRIANNKIYGDISEIIYVINTPLSSDLSKEIRVIFVRN